MSKMFLSCLLACFSLCAQQQNDVVPTTFPTEHEYGFIGAEFLYLSADLDGLSYAWSFPESYPAAVGHYDREGPLPFGTSYEVDFSWDPGFRLAGGYRFPTRSWETSLVWTYYQNHSHSSTSVDSFSNTLMATWFPAGFRTAAFIALDASINWRLHFNTLDLCLARSAFATKTLAIDPFMALTGAFIHQWVKTTYSSGSFLDQTGGGAGLENVSMTMHNNFDGWGLKPGLKTSWHLSRDWSLYANGAASLLFGRFSTKQKGTLSGITERELLNAHDSFYQNTFAIELAAGLKWTRFFDNQTKRVLCSVGYEMMSWFDQNQLFNYFFIDQAPGAGQPSQGDLGLQGINISMQVDF